MASMALSRAKAGADARLSEEKRAAEKKRNILVLCARYFQDLGYINTVMQIQSETGVSLSKIDVADNIDLGTILTEYEDFYEMRFGRRPKITRKQEAEKEEKKDHKSRHCSLPRLNEDGSDDRRGAANRSKSEDRANRRQRPPSIPDDGARVSAAQPSAPGASGREGPGDGLGIAGQNVSKASSSSGSKKEAKCEAQDKPGDEFYENQVLRALPNCGVDKDYRELALTISRDILSRNPGVPWNSIVGLGHAKALLKEAVVMPLKYPQLFQGLLAPWKGVLLFGPPGTGKTLLAKAVATECQTTFFNISASTVVSKWRGDSEKLIRVLFDLARHHQPSTIFMDEIDSIMSTREGGGSEHEGSRRMKTELLIQMDGLSRESSDQVFVLAASNLPWDLDSAMLRRLEKRILVSLPSAEAREVMFRVNLPQNVAQEIDYAKLASLTEDWSGSDVRLLCKEAAMHPLRRLMAEIERAEVEQEQQAQDKPNRRSAAEKAAQKSLEKVEPAANSELKVGAVTEADVTRALQTVHRAPAAHLDRYNQWQDQFGAA